jgi:hypothetical protein
MICLEVARNDKLLCLAGVPGGEIDGGVQWGSLAPGASAPAPEVYVVGATHNQILYWLREPVSVGDVIAFKVVDAAQSDPPSKAESTDSEQYERIQLRLARDQYLRAKRLLRKLEERWGPSVVDEDA